MWHAKEKGMKKSVYKQKMKDNRKQNKLNLQEKRARLMLRNIPFTSTEENLREHFEKFGKVKEVRVLKRPDGKLVGCAFIQYEAVQCAAKARFNMNGKAFLGREISCDFAVSKDRFVKKLKQDKYNKSREIVEIKDEPVDATGVGEDGNLEIKLEDVDTSVVKEEVLSDVEEEEEEETVQKDEESSCEEEASDESEDEEEESIVDDVKSKDLKINPNEPRKPHVISNDVAEGKTIFVKNLPFEATNQDLKECMRQFGTVYYALVCMDRATEHSKGTGFVKFVNKEDADKCLRAGTELTLLGNILDVHAALNKNDISKKSSEGQKEKHKDSRNLYLIKEGVILAGTKAAEGLSSTDMAKRLQLEQYKTQMLRNLNMFISRNRLVAHNLPASWDDAKLKALFMKHAGEKAFIRESKIMRDMKQMDSNGMGASKEFGFITFTTHDHALRALRALNNNPNVFSATKRPIVAFSIENRVMIKAKEKRMERSRLGNPLAKEYDSNFQYNTDNKFGNTGNKFGNDRNNKFGNNDRFGNNTNKFGNNTNNKFGNNKFSNNKFGNTGNDKFGNDKFGNNGSNNADNTNNKFGNNKFGNKGSNNSDNTNNKFGNNRNKFNNMKNTPNNNKFGGQKRKFEETATNDETPNKFTGVEASPGIKKMRSRYNLKSQAELHHQTLRTEKKKKKMTKKTLQERKQEFIRQPQQKIGKQKDQRGGNDNFAKMVNDYKAKLLGASSSSNPKQNNKGKWFDQ